MIRTQIQLTQEQARRLRVRAQEQGESLAGIIRTFVQKGLEEETPNRDELYKRAAGLAGRFRDSRGARDLSGNHDRYLSGAFR